MTITNTMKEISMVTPPMCAPVASGQNPKNSPKTPVTLGFGAVHLHLVSNPQNTIVGGDESGVSVTRFGGAGAYRNIADNSPFKQSIVSTNPDFSFNGFATKFDQTNKRNRQIVKTLKSDAIAKHQRSSNSIFPTHDPNSKMMNFIAIMLVARGNNPP